MSCVNAAHAVSSAFPHTDPRFRLLLVEDNYPDAMLVEEAIQQYHLPIEVELLDDGERAIHRIEEADRNPSLCPDLMVLDLNLPPCSGLEVLQRLRSSERCRHIPVVIVTSSDSSYERARAAQFGVRGYFRKPTDYDQFLRVGEMIREVVENLR